MSANGTTVNHMFVSNRKATCLSLCMIWMG
jgi:hypothetical protein